MTKSFNKKMNCWYDNELDKYVNGETGEVIPEYESFNKVPKDFTCLCFISDVVLDKHSLCWYKNGLEHRENGLCIENSEEICWYFCGVPHRIDGPAFEYSNGDKYFWFTDRTPHEALPVEKDTFRQYFRLVSHKVSVWWQQHSTPNPFGVQPDCKILTHSKFE